MDPYLYHCGRREFMSRYQVLRTLGLRDRHGGRLRGGRLCGSGLHGRLRKRLHTTGYQTRVPDQGARPGCQTKDGTERHRAGEGQYSPEIADENSPLIHSAILTLSHYGSGPAGALSSWLRLVVPALSKVCFRAPLAESGNGPDPAGSRIRTINASGERGSALGVGIIII